MTSSFTALDLVITHRIIGSIELGSLPLFTPYSILSAFDDAWCRSFSAATLSIESIPKSNTCRPYKYLSNPKCSSSQKKSNHVTVGVTLGFHQPQPNPHQEGVDIGIESTVLVYPARPFNGAFNSCDTNFNIPRSRLEPDKKSTRLSAVKLMEQLIINTHRIHGTGIFPYIWLIFMVVGKYTIHGSYGIRQGGPKLKSRMLRVEIKS